MKTFRVSILSLVVTTIAVAQTSPSPEDVQQNLCDQALRVGGSLESYLEGLGLEGSTVVGQATALFEALRGTHPELPESYLKLAVLMAVGEGTEPTAESAETTLRLLARCEEDLPAIAPPEATPAPETMPREEEPKGTGPSESGPPTPTAARNSPTPEPVVETDPSPSETLPAAGSPVAEAPATPTFGGPPRDLFHEAVDLAQRGAFEEAKEIFRSLIRSHPEMPEPYVNLGVLLTAEGQPEEAAQMAEGALFAHPICRAAFELTLIPALSAHSNRVLADSDRRSSNRVVGPLPETSDDVRTIAETVAAWSRAWAEERMGDFLNFYSENFQPAEGSRGQWRADLRERRAGLQSVKLEELSVDLTDPGKATAWFIHSALTIDGGVEIVNKVLELEKVGSAWKIVGERVGN